MRNWLCGVLIVAAGAAWSAEDGATTAAVHVEPVARLVEVVDPIAHLRDGDNMLTTGQALGELKNGNKRYLDGQTIRHPLTAHERGELVQAQEPFACVLTCSDSRVPVETIFDRRSGDLFVVRVAGNVVFPDVTASIEYAVAELGVPVVVVMGHQKCGAVGAALKSREEQAKLPGSLPILIGAVDEAVTEEDRKSDAPGLLDRIVRENVRHQVRKVLKSPVIAEAIAAGKCNVVGAYFEIGTGRVLFLEE